MAGRLHTGGSPALAMSLSGALLAGCTGASSGSSGCTPLGTELTDSRRPAGDVRAASSMCLPDGWEEDEVAADLAVVKGAAWLASGDCTQAAGRVWLSKNGGKRWRETARLGAGLHCSAGSRMDVSARDSKQAKVDVTIGAVIVTTTYETRDGGKSWMKTGMRCLDSDDPSACG